MSTRAIHKLNAEINESVSNLAVVRSKHFGYQKLHDSLLLALSSLNQAHDLSVHHCPERTNQMLQLQVDVRNELVLATASVNRTANWLLNGEKHIDALIAERDRQTKRRRRGKKRKHR